MLVLNVDNIGMTQRCTALELSIDRRYPYYLLRYLECPKQSIGSAAGSVQESFLLTSVLERVKVT